jgi:hypothetical protein
MNDQLSWGCLKLELLRLRFWILGFSAMACELANLPTAAAAAVQLPAHCTCHVTEIVTATACLLGCCSSGDHALLINETQRQL